MLIPEDHTAFDPVTKQLERVFPPGSVPQVFEASFPSMDVLRDLELDPGGLAARIDSWRLKDGLVRLDRLETLVELQMRDLFEALRQRVYAIASNFGLVDEEMLTTAPALFRSVLDFPRSVTGNELEEKMVAKVGLQIIGALSALSNPYAQIAMMVIALAQTYFKVISNVAKKDIRTARKRLPLQVRNADTDALFVNDIYRYLRAPERDLTALYVPRFEGEWEIRQAGKWEPGERKEWGFTFQQAVDQEHEEGSFTPTGGFGFMPGTSRILSVIQWRGTRLSNLRGRPANWYQLRCTAKSRGCGMLEEKFDGSVSCRQCVPTASLRGTSRGSYKDLMFAPRVSHAVNVGDFYSATNQSLTDLWGGMLNPRNPVGWSVDVDVLARRWTESFERFFAEDARRLWDRYDAMGWRFVCSNFFSWFLVSDADASIAGWGTTPDWRFRWGESRYSPRPLATVLVSPHGDNVEGQPTPFDLEHSVLRKLIMPALRELGRAQLFGYRTTMVAYLPWECGAHYDHAHDKIRDNQFGRAYLAGLEDLMHSPRRFSVDLRHVVAPQVRERLLSSGVNPRQIGLGVHAPKVPHVGLDGLSGKKKPPRAKPKTFDLPTLGSIELEVGAVDPGAPIQPIDPNQPPGLSLPTPPPPGGGLPATLGEGEDEAPDPEGGAHPGVALGVGLGGLSVAGLGALFLRRMRQ